MQHATTQLCNYKARALNIIPFKANNNISILKCNLQFLHTSYIEHRYIQSQSFTLRHIHHTHTHTHTHPHNSSIKILVYFHQNENHTVENTFSFPMV